MGKLEHIRRVEQAIARKLDASDTVLDRINRGGYTMMSKQAKAIRRKYQRMMHSVSVMKIELDSLMKDLRKG